MRLLAISRASQLGVDQDLAAKIGADQNSSPPLALAHASELAHSGKSADGMEFLTKAASAATTQPALAAGASG